MTKFENYQILLNKISHRVQVTSKLFSGQSITSNGKLPNLSVRTMIKCDQIHGSGGCELGQTFVQQNSLNILGTLTKGEAPVWLTSWLR